MCFRAAWQIVVVLRQSKPRLLLLSVSRAALTAGLSSPLTVNSSVNTGVSCSGNCRDDERQVSERFGRRNGLYRGSPPAAQEPERAAQLQRRLLERHGEDVREEDHDPGRPEPRQEQLRQPAGQQAGQPGRCAGPAQEGDGEQPPTRVDWVSQRESAPVSPPDPLPNPGARSEQAKPAKARRETALFSQSLTFW